MPKLRVLFALTLIVLLVLLPTMAWASDGGAMNLGGHGGGNTHETGEPKEPSDPYVPSLYLVAALTVLLTSVLITRILLHLKIFRSYVWLMPVLAAVSGVAWFGVAYSKLPDLNVLEPLLRFLLFFFTFLFFLYWVARAVMPSQAQRTRGGVPPLIRNLAVMLTAFLGLFLLLSTVFPNLSLQPLFVTSGVLSIVIGLAVQDVLTNLLAGVVISSERPFRVGDWIKLGNEEGSVASISWRTTKILTRENDYIIVPNHVLMKHEIMNFDQPSSRHVWQIFVGVSYSTPPALVINALEEAASRVENVLKSPPPHVHFKDFQESSLLYELRIWIDNYASSHYIDSEVRKEIWYAFKRHGVTIAFPQRDVNFRRIVDGPQEMLARLVATKGLPHGVFFELNEKRIVIGRDPKNEICVSDHRVSAEHAVIERDDDKFVLRDLGSRHGTRVNGVPIETVALSLGDEIEVGSVTLVFELSPADAVEGPRRWHREGDSCPLPSHDGTGEEPEA